MNDIAKTISSSRAGIGGRPRKLAPAYTPWPMREDPPENVQDRIRALAAEGRSLVLIAHDLGTSDKTLRRWMREDENLAWAYKVGLAQDEANWVRLLRRDAMEAEKTNANCLAYLNYRHGWRRDDDENRTSTNVVINLPGAMSLEKYVTVEADRG